MTAAEERARLDLLRRVVAKSVTFEQIEQLIADIRDGRTPSLRPTEGVA